MPVDVKSASLYVFVKSVSSGTEQVTFGSVSSIVQLEKVTVAGEVSVSSVKLPSIVPVGFASEVKTTKSLSVQEELPVIVIPVKVISAVFLRKV